MDSGRSRERENENVIFGPEHPDRLSETYFNTSINSSEIVESGPWFIGSSRSRPISYHVRIKFFTSTSQRTYNHSLRREICALDHTSISIHALAS